MAKYIQMDSTQIPVVDSPTWTRVFCFILPHRWDPCYPGCCKGYCRRCGVLRGGEDD